MNVYLHPITRRNKSARAGDPDEASDSRANRQTLLHGGFHQHRFRMPNFCDRQG